MSLPARVSTDEKRRCMTADHILRQIAGDDRVNLADAQACLALHLRHRRSLLGQFRRQLRNLPGHAPASRAILEQNIADTERTMTELRRAADRLRACELLEQTTHLPPDDYLRLVRAAGIQPQS